MLKDISLIQNDKRPHNFWTNFLGSRQKAIQWHQQRQVKDGAAQRSAQLATKEKTNGKSSILTAQDSNLFLRDHPTEGAWVG